MPEVPWLTVVTVVKDDPKGLARTRASVRDQDLTGVEFLVIDSSGDRAAASDLAGPEARVEWVPPTGIYPAMNVGIDEAAGEYLLFLNAGDTLASASVLSQLREIVTESAPQWLFGRVAIDGTDGSRAVTPRWDYAAEKASMFSRGLFPPHQGTVVRRNLLRSIGGFDTSYRISADYAAFLRMSQAIDPLQIDLVIASFAEGGTSTQQWKASFMEFHRARRAIFQPEGLEVWQERYNTGVHFAKVFAYREVIRRARR
jgi:GT2 family glycosyltransferase